MTVRNERILERLNKELSSPEPAGVYLFVGPEQTNKKKTALAFACALTEGRREVKLEKVVFSENVFLLSAEKEKSEQGAVKSENLGVEEVKSVLKSLAFSSRQKPRALVIDQADNLTIQAQNALLKILEEPPEGASIILLTDRPGALLPTVRSRLQVVRFRFSDTDEPTVDSLPKRLRFCLTSAENIDRLSLAEKISLAEKLSALEGGELAQVLRFWTEFWRKDIYHSDIKRVRRGARYAEAVAETQLLWRQSNVNLRLLLEDLLLHKLNL